MRTEKKKDAKKDALKKPTPVFLPGKTHGQQSLEGYGPWACKRVEYNLDLSNKGPPNL